MANRADRKKQLITQGAVYRAEVMLATQAVRAGLRPESLARNALRQAALIAVTAFKARNLGGLPGVSLESMLPIAMASASALSRNQAVVKVVLRGAVIAGTVAGAVRFLSKKKRPATDNPGV